MGLLGDIAGGLIGASASKKAAKIQAESTEKAIAEQRRQFDVARQDMAPYREVGGQAIDEIALQLGLGGLGRGTSQPTAGAMSAYGGQTYNTPFGTFTVPQFQDPAQAGEAAAQEERGRYGAFEETPGYQFRYDESMRALDRMGRARGRRYSGGTIREAQRYSSGLASQEYGDYFSRLQSAAGVGQTSTHAQANLGAQTAANIGSIGMYGGQARAQSALERGGAMGPAIGGAVDAAGSWLKDRFGSGGGSAGGGSRNPYESMSPSRNPYESMGPK